ncbi:MAG TPA: hypothetical protein VHP63_00765 [candidate division Zixibacteria bacterium]|nr:hypothetical protein [candidate division Zixibacteria bacterium]
MTKKNILLISYYFPPLGGVGINRPLALFQNLTDHGYDCIVLTVKSVLYRAYEPELLNSLNKDHIFRAGSTDPSRLLHLMAVRKVSSKSADQSRVMSKRFFPDSKAGWIGPAVRLGKKLLKENQFELIVSTSPPISAHVIAMELARTSSIPWVADFRDYWSSYKAEECFNEESKKVRARELLNEINSSARAIVAVNQSVADYVGASEIIPNSYDSQLAKKWRAPLNKEKFTIGVFGTISELTPIEPLLKVLAALKSRNQDLPPKVKVVQVGLVDAAALAKSVREYGLQDIFDLHGYQPREKAIEILSEAALFYLGVDPKSGFGLTSNRVFTLLSSGRPILAYAGKGSELDKILASTENSFRFEDNALEAAVGFVANKAESHLKGETKYVAEPDCAKEYSSERMVEKFARLFDHTTRS